MVAFDTEEFPYPSVRDRKALSGETRYGRLRAVLTLFFGSIESVRLYLSLGFFYFLLQSTADTRLGGKKRLCPWTGMEQCFFRHHQDL
jgi:hypothetical protein